LLLVLDDLQWCDAETLDWLRYALQAAPHLKLLVVGTVRDAELSDEHPLHKLTRSLLRDGQLTQIQLAPLSLAEAAHLGAAVTPQQQWNADADQTKQLLQDCAGNPLFIIESLRARQNGAADTQREQPGHTNLPPKVYAVIQERLTQLSPLAREMAELGAVIGRAFDVHLLAQASQRDEVDVAKALDELWRRKIARNPDAKRYDFSHDRIRDVAYAEIGPAKQTLLHGCVAQALQAVHGNQLESVYGELAEHQLRAGNLVQALANFRAAAATAKALLAHVEVVRCLEKAIAVTQLDTQNTAFQSAAIDLWHELGFERIYIHGYGSEPVAEAWSQEHALAMQNGTKFQRSCALLTLSALYRNRGEWRQGRSLEEMVLPLAYQTEDTFLIGSVLGSLGGSSYHFGKLPEAVEYLQHNIALSDKPVAPSFLWMRGSLADVTQIRLAKCQWHMGYPDRAYATAQSILDVAHTRVVHFERFALFDYAVMLHIFMRNKELVQNLSAELAHLGKRYEFPFYILMSDMYEGWLMAQRGNAIAGMALVQTSVDKVRTMGTRQFEPFWQALLAEVMLLAGQYKMAAYEINRGLAHADESGNIYWNAHLLKLKGDVLHLLAAPYRESEACYQHALEVARMQRAKSLELRAATALARLWHSQGKSAQAHQLLAPIYNWFTEGFGTPDLQEASALLAELA
jgi:tetratricopeptide (TPR) repeat protein